jgi:23S rRNA (guanosine2251-2'-O)-methyltransferase
MVEPPSPIPLELLFQAGEGDKGLWLALDQVQDPQNLGALFRLAGFFGVRGILLTKDRSAPVNATVCDVAAGGAEHVPFSVVANLAQSLEKAQENSIWVLGTCERADVSIYTVARDRHWMLVLGNEGSGLRRLTRERCDQLVSLPPFGPVPSLNVATAAAACLAVMSRPV